MQIPFHLQDFLSILSDRLTVVLKENAVGVYVHGSLSYGGYVQSRSDIDVVVIIVHALDELSKNKLTEELQNLSKNFPDHVKNLELDVLLLSDVESRDTTLKSLYTFMDNRPMGGETLDGFWIELANTRESGIVLFGPQPKDVVPRIDRKVLIRANKEKFQDLKKHAVEWEKINLWNQIYLLAQASRVLYSLNNDLTLTSKRNALVWVLKHVPEQFVPMLEVALAKLDDDEGPRNKVITDNIQEFFKYVEEQLKYSEKK